MIKIDYLIRTNRRSISISINNLGQVIIKAPRRVSMDEIQKVVDKKERWIALHKERIEKNNELNKNILTYKDILFCGNIYHIAFDERIKKITLIDNYCLIPLKYKDTYQRKLILWYKKIANEILTQRVQYFCDLMQLEPSAVKLTNARTCWGTCNSKGVVSLNWRLMMVPHNLIDYVVVHELAHLVQLNHSKLFWEVVHSVLPDYASRRKNLKQGDYLLTLFR